MTIIMQKIDFENATALCLTSDAVFTAVLDELPEADRAEVFRMIGSGAKHVVTTTTDTSTSRVTASVVLLPAQDEPVLLAQTELNYHPAPEARLN